MNNHFKFILPKTFSAASEKKYMKYKTCEKEHPKAVLLMTEMSRRCPMNDIMKHIHEVKSIILVSPEL